VQEIFQKDTGWLRSADVVVAEVSMPSLGVGYELGLAECLHKPVLALYREGANTVCQQWLREIQRFTLFGIQTSHRRDR
jgi:nucleoside 2-deoxyribosyltransferase